MGRHTKDWIRKYYRDLRDAGYPARSALRAARIRDTFETLEGLGFVRLQAEPDLDPSAALDFLDDRKAWPKSIADREYKRADRDGVWGLVGQYRLDPDNGTWRIGDSVWGFIGDDWRNSGYDSDIQAETVNALKDALRNRCRCCRKAN